MSLAVLAKLHAREAKTLRLFFVAIDCPEESATLDGEDRLGIFGVAELATTVRVATGFDRRQLELPVDDNYFCRSSPGW